MVNFVDCPSNEFNINKWNISIWKLCHFSQNSRAIKVLFSPSKRAKIYQRKYIYNFTFFFIDAHLHLLEIE